MNEIPGVTENVFEKIAANTKSLRYLHMKDYDHIKNRQELAQGLFRKISSLRIVKLGVRQEVHRNDVVWDGDRFCRLINEEINVSSII